MANLNIPNGFVPYRGGSSNKAPKINEYALSSSNSEIGIGTPVTRASGVINIAGTTDALIGISAEYKAANSGGFIKVWDDPQQLFHAQTDDGTGDLTAAADMAKNCTFVGSGVSNRISTAEIDENSGSNTATLLLKVMGLWKGFQGKAQNANGEFNRLIVKINNHQLQGHTGTAGDA